jgi:hypothetical protein
MNPNKKNTETTSPKNLITKPKTRYLAVWRTDKMIAFNHANVNYIKTVGIVEGSTLAEAQEAALKLVPGSLVFPAMYELDNIPPNWKLELV